MLELEPVLLEGVEFISARFTAADDDWPPTLIVRTENDSVGIVPLAGISSGVADAVVEIPRIMSVTGAVEAGIMVSWRVPSVGWAEARGDGFILDSVDDDAEMVVCYLATPSRMELIGVPVVRNAVAPPTADVDAAVRVCGRPDDFGSWCADALRWGFRVAKAPTN